MQPTSEALAQTYASKSDDELHSLHAGGTLTEIAYAALERELQVRGLAVPERPDAGQIEKEVRTENARITLAGHWKGVAPLASAYWLVGTLGFWVVYGCVVLVKLFVPILMPVAGIAFAIFLVFAWGSIWRCWQNTRWPIWGYVARGIVVLDAILVIGVAARVMFRCNRNR